MRKNKTRQMIITSLIIVFNFLVIDLTFAFDRQEAVKYADEYALSRNDKYKDYGIVDCTNFVSQCLRAGGLRFGTDQASKGGLDIKGSIIRASDMPGALENYHGATISVNTIPSNLKIGDVISFGNPREGSWWESLLESFGLFRSREFTHTVIVTETGNTLDTIKVNAHSTDRSHEPLSTYAADFKIIRYIHIPDSPVVKKLTLSQDNKEKIKFTNTYDEIAKEYIESISAYKETKIKIIFDTTMDTTKPITVFYKAPKLNKKVDPDGSGWTTTNYENDTWNGTFTLPEDKTYTISIDAYASDESRIDKNGKLVIYKEGVFEELKFVCGNIVKIKSNKKSVPTHQDVYSEGSEVEVSFTIADLRKLENVSIGLGDFFYNPLGAVASLPVYTDKVQFDNATSGAYIEVRNDSGIELHRSPYVGEAIGVYPLYDISAKNTEQEVNADETITMRIKISYVQLSKEAKAEGKTKEKQRFKIYVKLPEYFEEYFDYV